MHKFNIGDIVINKDKETTGYGSYGTISKLWEDSNDECGVEYCDQKGIKRRYFEYRLKLKERKIVQICGLAKFCLENYK